MLRKQFLLGSSHRLRVVVVTLLYALVVIFITRFHELWRDEIVPLSLVAESHSLKELFSNIHNFGHPILWYLILYVSYHVFPHNSILIIVNLLVSILAIYIFLDKSSFSWPHKMLFIIGFFPLYLYPIINRNYGISMLLIFLTCVLYKDRWKKFVPFGLCLFLLANTHAHSLIIVFAVLISLGSELLFPDALKKILLRRKWEIVTGFGIILVGMILSSFTMITDESSVIFTVDSLGLKDVIKAFLKAVVIPGKDFFRLFGYKNILFANIIILGFYLFLLRKLNLFLLFGIGVVGLSMFFQLIYPGGTMRHQGALYLLMIMVLWIDPFIESDERFAFKGLKPLADYVRKYKGAFIVFLMILQIYIGAVAINEEIKRPFSSAKQFSLFIKNVPSLNQAILISIPETYLETMPYYLDNPLYFFAEQKFARYERWIKTDQMDFTLGDLLMTAQRLKDKYRRPVVILLGEKITPNGPFEFVFAYKRKFNYTPEQLKEFEGQTIFLAHFSHAITDENYQVYLLK